MSEKAGDGTVLLAAQSGEADDSDDDSDGTGTTETETETEGEDDVVLSGTGANTNALLETALGTGITGNADGRYTVDTATADGTFTIKRDDGKTFSITAVSKKWPFFSRLFKFSNSVFFII